MDLVKTLIHKNAMREADVPRLQAAVAAAPNKPLHSVIIDGGFAKEEDVLPVLAHQFGMDFVDLTTETVEPEAIQVMPIKLVHRRNLMPLRRLNGSLIVATGDPFDIYAIDELQTLTGLHVQPVLASPREITRLIKTHFGVGGETVTALMAEKKKRSNCLKIWKPTTANSPSKRKRHRSSNS